MFSTRLLSAAGHRDACERSRGRAAPAEGPRAHAARVPGRSAGHTRESRVPGARGPARPQRERLPEFCGVWEVDV